jgi:hypothetical protein
MSYTYIANKHNKANITHMFWYDASLGTYSGNLMSLVPPFALFPAVPAVNDVLYICCDSTLFDSGPMMSFVFEIAGGSSLTTVAWAEWTGAWTAFSPWQSPYSTQFNTSGNYSVYFGHGGVPATSTINGVTGYWYRAVITAVGGAPTPPIQINTMPYSVTWPFVEFDEDHVPGDLNMLLKWIGQHYGADMYGSKFAIRSLDRGDKFTPYINLATSSDQNDAGITVGITSAAITNVAFSQYNAITNALRFDWAGNIALTELFYVLLDNTLTGEYAGTYHVYLRAYNDNVVANVVRVMLKAYTYDTGSALYQLINGDNRKAGIMMDATCPTDYICYDLGMLTLPRVGDDGQMYRYKLAIEGEVEEFVGISHYFFLDLILVPTDELLVESNLYYPNYTQLQSITNAEPVYQVIDSIGYPKEGLVSAYAMSSTLDTKIQDLDQNSVAKFATQHNSAVRLWHFMLGNNYNIPEGILESKFDVGAKVQILGSSRYLSMRGDR